MRPYSLFALTLFSFAALASPPATMAYWEGTGSNGALVAEAGSIRQLATDSWGVDATGAVTGSVPANVVSFAAQHGIQTGAVISNFGATDFDGAIAHAIFVSPAAQSRMFADMASIATRHGYAAINVDFEALYPSDRARFGAFVTAATAKMHAIGKKLVLSVPAMSQDDPTDSWTGAYHLAALGQAVDLVQYMTYDENGPWGPTGPVAGLDWVEATTDYALSVVPAAKLSLGVPAYGYDWDTTAGTGAAIYWNQIPALIASTHATPVWDATTSSPHFSYLSGGDQHVVWYENPRSITLKAEFATAKAMEGVSVFALGYENASFWAALKAGGQ